MTAMLAARPAFDTRRSAATRSAQMHRRASFGPHLAVQRDGVGSHEDGAASLVRNVVSLPGQPLDPGVRSVMETRLGYDFSQVRIHTDDDAARSAAAIGANAYAAGNHVIFGAGRFAPAAPDGQRVVAHELAHVIQQAHGTVAGTDLGDGVIISDPQDRFEREAVRLAEGAMTAPLSVERKSAPAAKAPDQNPGATPLAVQRDAAGWIGAIAGAAALIVAIGAWAWPRNANATGQGVAMLPSNPFPLPSASTPAADAKPEAKAKFQSAAEAPPKTDKVLELRTDDDNDQVFNLQRKTDGTHIISGIITAGDHKGYKGGYNGSIATVNFSSTQSAVAPEPSKTPAKTTPAPAKKAAPGKGSAGAPSSEAAPPPMDREVIDFSGTNGKKDEQLQMFIGELLVTGDGTVRCLRCEATNGIGYGVASGNYGLVDYRSSTPAGGANHPAAAANAPSAPGSPGAQMQPPSNPPNPGAGR